MGKGRDRRRRATSGAAGKTAVRSGTAYWHGGRAGRSVGDELIPGTDVAARFGAPDLEVRRRSMTTGQTLFTSPPTETLPWILSS